MLAMISVASSWQYQPTASRDGGGFWVQWQDVKEFGESLSTYPIEPDAPLKAQWGYEMQEDDDLILSVESGH
jgi:hypothetical protein